MVSFSFFLVKKDTDNEWDSIFFLFVILFFLFCDLVAALLTLCAPLSHISIFRNKHNLQASIPAPLLVASIEMTIMYITATYTILTYV